MNQYLEISFLLPAILLVLFIAAAVYSIHTSEIARTFDAEGRNSAFAFQAFLVGLGLALVAAALGAWLLVQAGWLAIAVCAAASLALFCLVVVRTRHMSVVPFPARITVMLSMLSVVTAAVAAAILGL